MKIAVLIGNISFDSQKRMINGILDKALIERTNVYVFVSEGGHYEHRSDYSDGEYNIYTLPDFTQYDGVIMCSDTIHDPEIMEHIRKGINEAAIPCVDMSAGDSAFMHVEMENTVGLTQITQHLITKHNARNVYFIAGPSDTEAANERLRAWQDTMSRNRIGWDMEHIYYGDYSFESGMRAARRFLNEARSMPDAIVAANDEMAVGAMLTLKAAGYRIPEDIMVTGYDESSIAEYIYPRLTTVRRGEYEAGNAAYTKIAAVLGGEETERYTVIQGSPVFADSCGCETEHEYGGAELQEKYVSSYIEFHRNLEILKNSAAEFTGLTEFEDFLDSLEQHIRYMGVEYFYLCMCGNTEEYCKELHKLALGEEPGRDMAAYTEEIWVPFAYEDGEVASYGPFHKSELLPEECKMKHKGCVAVVMPLHYRNRCFGYCVTGNYRAAIEGQFSQTFMLNLDNALETIYRHDVMKTMTEYLGKSWYRDELTGVCRETVFRRKGEEILKEISRDKKSVGVIFADIDDLKDVNREYGRDQGDILIKALASAMEQTMDDGELMCRLGGDEFVIMKTGCSEEELQDHIERIETVITYYNMVSVRPLKLSVSLGYCLEADCSTGTELNAMLEKANDVMYRNKKTKKMSQAEQAEI